MVANKFLHLTTLYLITLAAATGVGPRLAHRSRRTSLPVIPGAKPVSVERIKVHGTALEGNLEGDAVDREVLVFLPPSYAKDKSRRYPVVYALHGYSIGAEQWSHEIHVPQTIEGAFAQGAKEMIVVLPDSKTLHNGSMYSSSVTTGDFERFIAHDLVSYIDAHYRTIPDRREPRLGGPLHGRLRRDTHRHEACRSVRQSLHHEPLLLVASCRARPRDGVRLSKPSRRRKIPPSCLSLRAPRWQLRLPGPLIQRIRRFILICRPRTASRNPMSSRSGPPTHRLPFIDQYVDNLREYHGISIDVGDQDGLRVDTAKLHDALDKYGIANSFEVYPGTHTSKVADRIQNHVIPFFSQNLCFQAGCR